MVKINEEQYNNKLVGSGYSPSHSNVTEGTAKKVHNEPNTGGGGNNNRHCAAWEQVDEALNRVADGFQILIDYHEGILNGGGTGTEGRIGGGTTGILEEHLSPIIADIRKLANDSKMPLNRGE